ncbi:MAG TPA: tetratricopeptide repeat protein, partial [Methylomirabilota bacterium]|nr:tetratricopeptide repeat protein [Methylomirabilota bacterium]
FREAEPLARELVRQRGAPFDHGLLGDVLLDLGRFDEALTAYQTMMDLKPDLHAYARAAHLRWLAGFVPEAIELLSAAAAAASPRDPEGAAWVWTRLAQLQFQAGARRESRHAWTMALAHQSNYAPALLLRGRSQLAEGDAAGAVESLRRAAQINPLPEYEWALSEAYRIAGRIEDARRVEDRLRARGPAEDPRTVALYLATRGEDPATAVRLARRELEQRADVFTHDALAWALAAAGQVEAAREPMTRALAHGTQDGRLFLHAAVIASRSGQIDAARSWAAKAAALKHLLLPSEQEHLARLALAATAPLHEQTFSTAGR